MEVRRWPSARTPTEAYPDGLPNLSSRDAKRVEVDNKACAYVLQEIQRLHGRGGGSVRENPALVDHHPGSHVCGTQANGRTPPMQPARWEGLILRHNIDEIAQCYRVHDPAEYTAAVAFAVAAAQRGLAKFTTPRDLDPRALRECAMAPMGVTLRLTAALQESRPGYPPASKLLMSW